jgi:hypothetical protein
VSLKRAESGAVSGSIAAATRSVTDTGKVTIRGSFRDLLVRPQARGCVARQQDSNKNAQSRDTLVH